MPSTTTITYLSQTDRACMITPWPWNLTGNGTIRTRLTISRVIWRWMILKYGLEVVSFEILGYLPSMVICCIFCVENCYDAVVPPSRKLCYCTALVAYSINDTLPVMCALVVLVVAVVVIVGVVVVFTIVIVILAVVVFVVVVISLYLGNDTI